MKGVKNIKSLTGIVLILIALMGIIFWEGIGREIIMYDDVLVLTQEVDENTIITKEMLGKKKVAAASKGALTLENVDAVIDKAAVQYIPKGTEIFPQYFEDSKLLVKENEYVLSIPNDWLESYPQTLRRGDTAYFYTYGKKITSAVVAYAKDGTNQEVTSDEERLAGSSTISLVEVIVNEEQADLLSKAASAENKFVILYN